MKRCVIAAFVCALIACGNTTGGGLGGGGGFDLGTGGTGGYGGKGDGGGGGVGGGGASHDMAMPSSGDMSMPSTSGDMASTSTGDGTPMQGACTSSLGSGMSATFGRLDGYVWSVVPAGTSSSQCANDSTHVHIQVKMNGAVYDLASPDATDVFMLEKDIALPGFTAWSEGWHTNVSFDYPTEGIHSTDSGWMNDSATIRSTLATELAHANHVAVFTTGYGSNGGHLIHRQGSNNDGAIVINPLSSPQHVFFFHFQTSAAF